ncbi:MAG: transcriptional regulator GcvA [Alphaproteobacteria bacterium]|nr:transcriptional regulator GcvA [Alphaproteobacteria bacterium]
MSSRRLPPLNALRAFEAAARNGGFTAAARELNVTPAAISQHVAALEAHLGVKLFRRLPRGLELTDSGRAYLPGLEEGFATLAAATQALRGRPRAGRLVVSALPSFATGWLVPRLPDFRRRYPEIDVVLRSEWRFVDFAREAVDVAIRYTKEPPANLRADRLLPEALFLCAAPVLAQGLRRPADLRGATLLHDSSIGRSEPRLGWEPWIELLGLPRALAARGPGFSDSSALYAAARLGQGVAVGRSVPLADDIAAGRLVRLFDLELPSGFAYWVVAPKAASEDPRVAAFRAWVLDAAHAALL